MIERFKFTKEEKQSDREEMVKMLKNGLSYSEMQEEFGRSISYWGYLKKDLLADGLITQEEIDEAKKRRVAEKEAKIDPAILRELKLGKNRHQIYQVTGESDRTIEESTERLIAAGLISRDDVVQGFVIDPQKEAEVLECMKARMSASEASKKLQIPRTTLNRYVERLINDGKLTRAEIKHGMLGVHQRKAVILKVLEKRKYTNEEIADMFCVSKALITIIKQKGYASLKHQDKIDFEKVEQIAQRLEKGDVKYPELINVFGFEPPINTEAKEQDDDCKTCEVDERRQEILSYLKSYPYIAKKLGIDQVELMDIVQTLKKEKQISNQQIKEAQEAFRVLVRNRILSYLKRGFSQREMAAEICEISQANVSRIISSLKREGTITAEQIEYYKRNAEQGRVTLSKFVLQRLRLGYTDDEIIADDPNGFLTDMRVRLIRKELVDSGQITQKKIDLYRKKRRMEKQKNELDEFDKEVFRLIGLGFTLYKIADKFRVSYTMVIKSTQRIRAKKNLTMNEINALREKGRSNLLKKQSWLLNKVTDELSNAGRLQHKRRVSFFENCKLMLELELPLSHEDIRTLADIVLFDKEFFSKEHVRFVINLYLKSDSASRVKNALNFINEVRNTYEDSEDVTFVKQMHKSLIYKLKFASALNLLKQKKDPIAIAEELGFKIADILGCSTCI